MRILVPTANSIPFLNPHVRKFVYKKNTTSRSPDVDYIRDPLYLANR